MIRKVENTVPWTEKYKILAVKKSLERFMTKKCEGQVKESLGYKKEIKKVINCQVEKL